MEQAQAHQVDANRLNGLPACSSRVLDGVCIHRESMDGEEALIFVCFVFGSWELDVGS